MATWQCVKLCGACCHLDPAERPQLDEYLSPQELQLYLSMVGKDGWCIYFDPKQRKCRIYEQRPRFCRVQPDTFKQMYGIEATQFNEFAIDCCHQQIEGVYGTSSPEMQRYRREIGETPS